MDCCEPKSACPPCISSPSPHACCPSASHDPLVVQDEQHIDVPSPTTGPPHGKNRKISHSRTRSWQKPFDSQDFGFSSAFGTFGEPVDVATADELFYNGHILPLQSGTRLQAMASLTQPTKGGDLSRTHVRQAPALSREDEVKFTSCRIEVSVLDKVAMTSMQRSLSFRSQNSGYSWESGAEKDTGESSSSARDSNGSSQDSCIANSSNRLPPVSSKLIKPGFNSWKFIFGGLRKGSKREKNPTPPLLHRVGFSEDLSRYKHDVDRPPVKEAMVSQSLSSLKLRKETGLSNGRLKSKVTINHLKTTGDLKEKSFLGDGQAKTDGEFKCTNSSVDISSCTTVPHKEIEKKKEQKAVLKQKWQGYGRKLKPFIEMKKGLMGQFKMDDCGKNACEVESGIIRRPRPTWQRRLSHQASFFKKHKRSMNEEMNESSCTGNIAMPAMTSCPPSTMSSPNHSGLLALVVDTKPKHGGIVNNPSNATNSTNEYMSMRTMHEIHNAVQSAIAHCKESNKQHSLN